MEKKIVLGIVTNSEKILIVRRKEKEKNLLWQFPGGEREIGETDEQAVLREIKEETGVESSIIKCLGDRIHPYTNREMSYWACDYISGGISISDDDLAEAKWINITEIKEYFTTDIYEPVLAYINSLCE